MRSVVFFCVTCSLNAQFSTLSELRSYAAAYPETVVSDNNNWANPLYTNFYDRYKPTLFSSLKRFFSFSKKPLFDTQIFENLIGRVYERRKEKKSVPCYSTSLQLNNKDKCIMWGDVHGAFHSLVRDLHELHRLGILSEQLIITPPYHFIFLGDQVSRSSYSLETLSILLNLMDKNPDQVVYLRGPEESDHYWENFTMRDQLQAYAVGHVQEGDGATPLRMIINNFFETLPCVVELHKKDGGADAVYCMHDESRLKGANVNVKVVIYGERYANVDPLLIRYGLEYLGFSQGVAEWTIMSCPVQLYQSFFNFYYDTFVMFEMSEKIESSTITLYNHDIRKSTPDFTATSYDIIFGTLLKSGDNDTTSFANVFNFGSTIDLSSVVSSLGINIKRGIDFVVHDKNMMGGVQNYFIKPTIFDDRYDPRIAYKNIELLLHGFNINIMLAPVGTATLLLSLDKIKKGEITVLFPITGYPALRDPSLKYMVHLRASYADESCALINYIIKAYGSKNFAFFYQDDAYGKSALAAAHAELEKNGLKSIIDIPYLREQSSFKEEAAKLKKVNIDALGLFSASLSTQIFLSEVGVEYLKAKHIFAMSFLESEDLKQFLFEKGIKQTFSYVVPNPSDSNLPIVEEYRTAMKKHGLEMNSNALEGWIVMSLVLDALQHIAPPFSAEKIITYFEGLKNYDLGGLKLTFDPKTRSFNLPVLIQNEDGVLMEYQNCKEVINPADRKFLV